MMNAAANRSKQRRIFFIVLALFFSPLAAAFLVYYGMGWRPPGNTSTGDLINPARPLPSVSLPNSTGGATSAEFLRDKWSMVYLGDGACDDNCRRALTDMRQIRLALNKDMGRVQRVFLYTNACCDAQYFNDEQSGVIAVKLDSEQGAAMLPAFPSYGGVPALQAGRVYLVDPLGNLMMSYAPSAPPKGILSDLKKLLKLSHIG